MTERNDTPGPWRVFEAWINIWSSVQTREWTTVFNIAFVDSRVSDDERRDELPTPRRNR